MAASVTNMIVVSREVTRVVKHHQKAEGCWSESEGSARKEQMAKKEGAGVLMLMMMVQEVFKFKISSMMNYYY